MMGWDMRMGLDAARGTYIGVIDGDGQFPPESIIACLLKCELEDLDLTKTYRVVRDDGWYRRFISAVYNAVFSLLFGFKVKTEDGVEITRLNSSHVEISYAVFCLKKKKKKKNNKNNKTTR